MTATKLLPAKGFHIPHVPLTLLYFTITQHHVFTATLILLPLSLAVPLVEHLVPIRHAVDVGGHSANGGYIVTIKLNTLDPKNRLQWFNKVLTAPGITLDEEATQSLKLKWIKDVFNGIAGKLSTEALNVLCWQPEVAWIEQGPSNTVPRLSAKLES